MPSRDSLTLPSHRRIRHRTEFDQALRADSLANAWFVVHSRANENGFSRLGIIASKRIMPNAVSRNFAKRMIREVFRRNFPDVFPLDVVVRARRQLNQETSVEGRSALLLLLQAVQK